MPCHVGPPQGTVLLDRTGHRSHRIRIVHARLDQRIQRSSARARIGEPEQNGQYISEHISFLAKEREIDKAQVQVAILAALQHIVIEQSGPAILGKIRRERMKQSIEIVQRLGRSPEAVELLHEIPQSVCVEHESRARHDVRPVAGFILLQQKEALMLLRRQPLNRELDARGISPPQPARTLLPIQQRHRDQPPQGRIDAPQIPEIRLLTLQVHEFGNLSVGRLVPRQGVEAQGSCALQRRISRQGHSDGANRGVASEYGRVAALFCARAGRGRQHTAGGQISLQECDRPRMAGLDQRQGLGLSRSAAHRIGMIAPQIMPF